MKKKKEKINLSLMSIVLYNTNEHLVEHQFSKYLVIDITTMNSETL